MAQTLKLVLGFNLEIFKLSNSRLLVLGVGLSFRVSQFQLLDFTTSQESNIRIFFLLAHMARLNSLVSLVNGMFETLPQKVGRGDCKIFIVHALPRDDDRLHFRGNRDPLLSVRWKGDCNSVTFVSAACTVTSQTTP